MGIFSREYKKENIGTQAVAWIKQNPKEATGISVLIGSVAAIGAKLIHSKFKKRR